MLINNFNTFGTMTKTERIAWRVFLLALLAAVVCGVCACSKKVYVPAERVVVRTDSVAVQRADSLTRLLASRDSFVVRDSVFVMLRGDTVIKEAWRIRERVSLVHDTVRIGAGFTAERIRLDSVRVPEIVTVEKVVTKEVELGWWRKCFLWTGGIFWSVFALGIIYTIVRFVRSRKL